MTQEQRLAALLTEFGVPFTTLGHEPGGRRAGAAPSGQTILIEQDYGESPRVVGYPGFECEFVFDEGGNFVEIGIWE